MINKYKKVTKPSSIGSSFNPELVNKLNNYSKLIGVNRTKLVSSLITKELEGKVLNNVFINLDEPYYFNFDKLINEGTVEATLEKPTINIENMYILKKVPNNLDKINEKYKTYSFKENNPNFHRGLYYYAVMNLAVSGTKLVALQVVISDLLKSIKKENFMNILYNTSKGIIEEDVDIPSFYFLFEFDQKSKKLTIQKIEGKELRYVVGSLDYPDVIEDLVQQEISFRENIIRDDGSVDVFLFLKFMDVMMSYKKYKNMDFELDSDVEIYDNHIIFKYFQDFKKLELKKDE